MGTIHAQIKLGGNVLQILYFKSNSLWVFFNNK